MSEAPEEHRWNANARQIHSEAASWIERRESATWDEAEKAQFEAWLSQSSAHMVAHLRAEDVWRRADRLRALSRPLRRTMPPGSAQRSKSVVLRGCVALVVIGTFAAATGEYMLPTSPKVYATPIGGRETLTLDDGTQIDLNTDTVVRVSQASSQRMVWLEKGEAYFDVKYDAAHPFTVMAGQRRITDLGTKFLARNAGAHFEVALMEGSARVDSINAKGLDRSAVLTPGDVAIATDDAVSVTSRAPNVLTRELGWRHGVLIFDSTTLAEAAAEFNRYNSQKLVIAGQALAKKPIDGTFRANDVDAFLGVMHDLIGLNIERKQNVVIISQRAR